MNSLWEGENGNAVMCMIWSYWQNSNQLIRPQVKQLSHCRRQSFQLPKHPSHNFGVPIAFAMTLALFDLQISTSPSSLRRILKKPYSFKLGEGFYNQLTSSKWNAASIILLICSYIPMESFI